MGILSVSTINLPENHKLRRIQNPNPTFWGQIQQLGSLIGGALINSYDDKKDPAAAFIPSRNNRFLVGRIDYNRTTV